MLGRTIYAVIHTMARTYVIAFVVITPLMMLLIGSAADRPAERWSRTSRPS